MKTRSLLAALAVLALPLHAQKMQTPAGEAPGPWILGTIGVGKTADPKVPKTTALKGLAIKVGEKGEAAVAYDLDLCRMAGAWTGKFTTPMNLMSRGEYPTAMGEVAFTTEAVPGFTLHEPAKDETPAIGFTSTWELTRNSSFPWVKPDGSPAEPVESDGSSDWNEVRSEPFGPLPPGQARFKGFYVNGGKVVLKWNIEGTEILEMPEYISRGGLNFFVRNLWVAPHTKDLDIPWHALNGNVTSHSTGTGYSSDMSVGVAIEQATCGESVTATFVLGHLAEAYASTKHHQRILTLRPSTKAQQFKMAVWSGPKQQADANQDSYLGLTKDLFLNPSNPNFPDLRKLTEGGPAHWPEPVITTGDVSDRKDEAYVVDTIKLPDPNPWGAPMFVGGFDFFEDGRAAVCTFHGDVFVVSGLDDKLEKVTWRRFASGLYHALGLKIVKGEIYVTCRDGLWHLKDLNGDGEADSYELFNGDVKVTKSFHEFVFDLQTDPAGNFYFSKAGPVKNGGRGFDEIMAHHGSLLRVSADGSKLDAVATGFRAPNGIGCGPDGQLTSGDNEGTWTPACKINWIQPGGFYGVVPLSHRDPAPMDYDRPLCWLPKRVDNSGGGQVWVTSDQWGPWKDQMLHLSYGTCSVFGVLKEATPKDVSLPSSKASVTGIMQGGVVRFPVNFQSGIMRARFNPQDGQLYVGGLRGWQTTGVKNGAFQRVRYTGAPVRMPIGLHTTTKGLRLDFTTPLDPATANDPQNWNVEVWNYLWSSAYGSPELSTAEAPEKPGELGKDGEPQFTKAQAGLKKHDSLTVKSATLSADGKSVSLELPEIKPVMQMAIKFSIKSADGIDLRSEVINTIHALHDR